MELTAAQQSNFTSSLLLRSSINRLHLGCGFVAIAKMQSSSVVVFYDYAIILYM